MSIRTIGEPVRHSPHLPWLRRVRSLVRNFRDLDLLMALVPGTGGLPDFLTPPPATPLADLDDELEKLVSTPAHVVRRDLGATFPNGTPAILAALERDPEAGLPRVAETIGSWFEVALRADWPRIQAMLEADILHRARRMARGGAGAIFSDLDPWVTFNGEALRIRRHWTRAVELTGTGLVLVPSAFVRPRALCIAHPPCSPHCSTGPGEWLACGRPPHATPRNPLAPSWAGGGRASCWPPAARSPRPNWPARSEWLLAESASTWRCYASRGWSTPNGRVGRCCTSARR